MKQKRGGNFFPISEDYERKRLEVNFWLILTIALTVTIIIYALVLPIRSSFLGILLYDRGFTQHLAIWFASIVAVLTVIKLIKVSREFQGIKKLWISDIIAFDNPQSLEVVTFQKSLARENSLVALRCSRVIAAYIQSNSRKAAAEFSLDDSSFYVHNSESSYAFPRILIWAIPLLGFIGTVIGISQAVNGFNGFLDQSGDVEQIKEGIGTVTTGLAVAFDTTLLALLLSVLVMIPLVLVERYESKLLLAIDIFINDQLLPRFKEENAVLEPETINKAVSQAIKEHLPSPQALIDPAHEYAKQAVNDLTHIVVNEFSEIQKIQGELITQFNRVNQLSLQDKQSFTTALEKQQQAYQDLILRVNSFIEQLNVNSVESLDNQQKLSQDLTTQVNSLVEQLKINYDNTLENQHESNQNLVNQLNSFVEQFKNNSRELSVGLTHQSNEIANQLKLAANLLETRIKSLETATYQLSEITQLKTSFDRLIDSLEKVDTVEQVILDAMTQIKGLKPSLEKLSKPRIITFAESDELGG